MVIYYPYDVHPTTQGYLVPDTCKQILWANIICDTFCTILITSNMFLEILSKFKLAFYYLINTCLKIATLRSCCTSRNFLIMMPPLKLSFWKLLTDFNLTTEMTKKMEKCIKLRNLWNIWRSTLFKYNITF